jgi:hypothetical protein
MDAADPAARTPLAFEELFARSLDAPSSGLILLGIFNPANKFVAA